MTIGNGHNLADCATDIFMSFLYTWPNPAGSFRGYRTRNCSIQEMLNIRLAYKSLYSCSENSSNKAMKVQLLWFLEGESEINIQHNSFIMQISNALTQAHPTDINTVDHLFCQ